MGKEITEEKLKEAKAKLACHIEPPKGSAFVKALAEQAASAASDGNTETVSSSSVSDGGSCSASGGIPMRDGKIRLTEMTSAGG